MRILMPTQTFFPTVGGGVRYKTAVVEYFRRLGHTVDVLAVNQQAELAVESEENGVIVRVPQLVRFDSAQIAPAYLWLFGKLAPQYDVLHFQFPSPMAELAFLLNSRHLRGKRKLASYHGEVANAKRFSGAYNRFLTHPFLGRMDAIIAASPNIAESSVHLVRHRDRVRVIPYGVDPAAFEQRSVPPRASNRELQILFVGRLARYKGIDILIEAMVGAPGRLTIVGEGPLRSGLEALARSRDLVDRVSFTGFLSDEEVVARYHGADILVLPSIDSGETFGYVLIEAMMCHTAIISTEVGTGTSYVNVHGETGLVIPPSDPAALREAITSLASDAARLEQFKSAARRRALERFTLQRMLAETEALYANPRG